MTEKVPRSLRRASTLREIANESGYDAESGDQLIFKPQEFTGQTIHKKLSDVLTPETITAIFDNLEGGGAETPRDIIRLGNTLYEFEKNLATSPDKTLLKEEEKLLAFIVKLLERALYRGGLSALSEKNAAAMAFLINRLGKIKEIAKPRNEKTRFNYTEFQGFVEEVEDFFEEYFTKEHYDKLIADRQERTQALEVQMLERGNDEEKKYVQNTRDRRALEEELEELESEKFLTDLKDLTRRLEQAVELFRKLFTYVPSDKTHRDIDSFLSTLKKIKDVDLLKLLEPESLKPNKYILVDLITAILYLANPPVKDGDYEKIDNQAEKISEAIGHYVYNLRSYKEKYAESTGKRHKDFSDLARVQQAAEIDDDLLVIYDELTSSYRDGRGIWKEATQTILGLSKAQRNHRPYNQTTDTHYNLELEIKKLKKERTDAEKYKQRVRRAKEIILREVKNRPEGDMYLLKTILVGADMLHRRNYQEYTGFSLYEPAETIGTYEMVKLDPTVRYGANVQANYDLYDVRPIARTKHSDVHYRIDQLPFAIMVARYFKEKESKRESEQN